MMTVTPPRSESSPDISPCVTPSAHLAPKSSIATPSPTISSAGIFDSTCASNQAASNQSAAVSQPNTFQSSSGDSHLHSILHGRPLVNFQKGPSPPQDSILFNQHNHHHHHPHQQQHHHTSHHSHNHHNHINNHNGNSFTTGGSDFLRRNSVSSYRNALTKGQSLADIVESDFSSSQQASNDQAAQSLSSVFSDFSSFDAASWSNALGNLGRISATAQQSAVNTNVNSVGPGNTGNNGHGPKPLYGHRNTMPSMPTSPFAFDSQFAFNANHQEHNGASGRNSNNSAPSSIHNQQSSSSSLPYCGSSLNCYLVQFTSGRTDTYFIPQDSQIGVNVGDYVVVEADRGEDLGRVIMDNINVPLPRRNSASGVMGMDASSAASSIGNFDMDDQSAGGVTAGAPQSNLPKQIYRVAQAIEVESLLGKVRDELNAIAVGQYKVQEWKLPMVVIDAEYQWDRRKLTFFFSVTLPQYFPNQPSPRIDFRTLVRDLYQIYRTRIWMYCVDKDKNRTNRTHNREKFLKQLYKDVGKGSANGSVQIGSMTNSTGGLNGGAALRGHSHLQHSSPVHQNSLKAVLEDQNDNWDIIDKINEGSIDVEDLSFGMAGMSVNR